MEILFPLFRFQLLISGVIWSAFLTNQNFYYEYIYVLALTFRDHKMWIMRIYPSSIGRRDSKGRYTFKTKLESIFIAQSRSSFNEIWDIYTKNGWIQYLKEISTPWWQYITFIYCNTLLSRIEFVIGLVYYWGFDAKEWPCK